MPADVIAKSLNPSIKVGDWCTQYSAGFWQVVELAPKYAEEDGSYEGHSWKKGDLIGHWALMKKGFTPKMKFRADCDACDAAWCDPVSEEQLSQIREFFETHPKEKEKFEKLPWKDVLSVSAIEMNDLRDEDFARIQEALKLLPETFTEQEFRTFAHEHGIDEHFSDRQGGATCYLYVFCIPYRFNENRELLHCKPELKRMA